MSVRPLRSGPHRAGPTAVSNRAGSVAGGGTRQSRPVRQFEVERFAASSVIPLLQRELARLGLQSDEVLVRTFSRDRLDQALRSGTDRSADSNLFVGPNGLSPTADCDAAVRAAAGVTADQLIYANRVVWKGPQPKLLTALPATGEVDATPWEESPDFSPEFSADTILAVYDPSKLRLAPGATVEYWFETPPKDALLFLVAEPAADADRNQARHRAEHEAALRQLGLDADDFSDGSI